jgi:small subunit ribosomal protein S7
VVKNDESAKENLPKVLKEDLNSTRPKGTRSFSTIARQHMEMTSLEPQASSNIPITNDEAPAPGIPIPRDLMMKHRYDPLVEQMTNLIMRDGKKATAQRVRDSDRLERSCARSLDGFSYQALT